jgi:hypothetical protein
VLRFAAIISGLTGVFIFSSLIAFITTTLQKNIYEFRKGRSRVLEVQHTLILGWNERLIDILRELIRANESERKAIVVVLANVDKEQMDDDIYIQIPDTKTTQIITRHGNPASVYEMQRVNASKAKSAIILATVPHNASHDQRELSDIQTIKVVMALTAVQEQYRDLPIVVELYTEEKRQLAQYFNEAQLVTINTWQLMGKLLLQTSLSTGLERVYQEIDSFIGSEIYIYKGEWEELPFYESLYHFEDGIPLGIFHADGSYSLRPEPGAILGPKDELIILATDDSTIKFNQRLLITPKEYDLPGRTLQQEPRKILILGWHEIGHIYLSESVNYLLPGSRFDIVINHKSSIAQKQVAELQETLTGTEIKLLHANTLNYTALSNLRPFQYDKIIILSQDEEELSSEKIDSDMLLILMMLRRIAQEQSVDRKKTKIITQVLNSENQDLLAQNEVDDFITSNKLITMVLAQLSEQPRLSMIYEDLFQSEGSEIYVKPAYLYFKDLPVKLRFIDLLALAHKREEICLGIHLHKHAHKREENFGVRLNIDKDAEVTISQGDSLVVLAETER